MFADENIWKIWRGRVKQAVRGLADEAMQRRGWLGIGPEESSPTEDICQLVDDTDFEKYLDTANAGYTTKQVEAGKQLLIMIQQFPHKVRDKIKPEELINDPRWVKIRDAAKNFLTLLD